MILRQYGTPDKILRGHKKTMIEKYQKPQEKDFQKLPSAMKSSVPPQQPQKLSDARLIVSISTSL